MAKRYRKKPVEVDAMKWTGSNKPEVIRFAGKAFSHSNPFRELFIKTKEGTMLASVGDYIIRGGKGEVYPCKPDIFERTYEEVTPGRGVERSLTLRELKELKGEPIWIRFLNGCPRRPEAYLLIGVHSAGFAVVMGVLGGSLELLTSRYGFTWVAYDHKPKGEL